MSLGIQQASRIIQAQLVQRRLTCDELHKNGEIGAKPFSLFPEQGRLGNAARVHAAKRNARQFVVLGVQKVGHHHETKLGVLVSFGANKAVAVGHGHGVVEAGLEAIQLVKIGNGIDAATTHSIIISRDAAHHNDACIGRIQHGVHEQTDHQKVRQEVDLHGLLVVVGAPLGIVECWLVNTGIANEAINGFVDTELFDLLAKVSHRIEGVEFTLNGCEAIHIKAIYFGDRLHLV